MKGSPMLAEATLFVTCDSYHEIEAMIGKPHPQFKELRCVVVNATPNFDCLNNKRVYDAHYWAITDKASWALIPG